MLWRSRDCCGTRLSQITYPKCTSRNICAYRSIVIQRRGNSVNTLERSTPMQSLNESPRPKAGKSAQQHRRNVPRGQASMEVPARRRGNLGACVRPVLLPPASMKVPARKRGNSATRSFSGTSSGASMKVPTRRRRNKASAAACGLLPKPQ